MYKIDLHNYESYLLDFSEGNLSDEAQMELELFLIQHPELHVNLDDLSLVYIEEEAAIFSNKKALKKSDSDLVSETQFIAYIEHQLSDTEKLQLEKSCAVNPSIAKELKLYSHTIASFDANIVFENKKSLKRKPAIIWFNFSTVQYAAAACIVFLIGLFMLWPKSNINSDSFVLANKITVVKPSTMVNDNIKNTSPHNNSSIKPTPKSINTALVQHLPSNKNEQHVVVNNANAQSISVLKDSINAANINSPQIQKPKTETFIAINNPSNVKSLTANTVVQVITENDDEPIVGTSDKKKTGIWATASRALKNLNQVGVKTVNGDEEVTKQNTAYAITLGGVSITHKAGL